VNGVLRDIQSYLLLDFWVTFI